MGMRPTLTLDPHPRYAHSGQFITRLRSQQCWRLLALLAESDAWIERDSLARDLWPTVDGKKSRQNLRQCLLYIRQGLPGVEGWLCIEADRLRMDLTAIDVETSQEAEIEDDFDIVVPKLAEVFSRMDSQARRAAVVGLTPTWIGMGCHSEGLGEIERLVREKGGEDVELLMCQADLLIASFQLNDAIEVMHKVKERLQTASPQVRAAFIVARCQLMGRMYNFPAAIRDGMRGFQAACAIGDRNLALRALMVAGFCLADGERSDEARDVLAKAKKLLSADPKNPWRPTFLHLTTLVEISEKNFEAARASSDRAMDILHCLTQPGLNGAAAARIGRLRETIGDYTGALKLYEFSNNVLADTECRQEKAEIFTYLGDLYRHRQVPEKSFENHQKAVVLRRALKTPDALGTSLRGAGMAAQMLNDHRTAISCLSESTLLFEGCGRSIGKASSEIALARSLAKTSRRPEAIPMFERGLGYLDRELVGMRTFQLPVDLAAVDQLKTEFQELTYAR